MDVLFVIGGKNFQLPRLIGAFLVFGAVLMLFQGVAHMFDVWDSLKSYPNCVSTSIDVSGSNLEQAQSMYKDCREILYRKTGIQLLSGQIDINARQYWIALISPVAGIFLWAIVFFFGIMFYNTGKIIIPIERAVTVPAIQKKKKGAK
ncbi:MAG: hypothetical protein NT067_04990 [Candidatus Diapherotrites archaeon]|nr:hypothetical protein [Candidatus Diapherotrites archaeon]